MVRFVRRNAPNEIGSLDAVHGGSGTAAEMLTPSGEPSSAVEPEIEFRSPVDDAWYNARPFLDGEKLTVRLVDFTDDQNEVYEAGKFTSVEVLNDLESRFRSISVQLQDSECSKVVDGIRVCASYSTDRDLRFYDAVVENKQYKEHSFAKGEEECNCSFLLVWQHGPSAGNLAEKHVADICVVQFDAQRNPDVALFLKIVKQNIESCPTKSGSAGNGGCHKENHSANMKEKLAIADRVMQGRNFAKRCSTNIGSCEGGLNNLFERNSHDADVGGDGNHHTILLENVERDLSSSAIVEFIHQQTSITSQAYVFPSLSSDLYTRGVLALDAQKDHEDVYNFLNKPDHIIVSSRGRPWVVSRNLSRSDLPGASLRTLVIKSQLQKRTAVYRHELKVVRSGTKGFKMAKELKDLFMEFNRHQERLFKRLALEERKVQQTFMVE